MTFDAFWQTHRRFITGVTIGFVVFLILRAVMSGGWKGDLNSAKVRIRSATRDLNGPHVQSSEVTRAQNALAQMQAESQVLAERCLAPWPEAYRPGVGQSASKHYIEFTGRRRQELLNAASLHGVLIDDSLGLPVVSPTQPQILEKVLRGFWIVDQVVQLATTFRSEEVDDIRISTRGSRAQSKSSLTALDSTAVELAVVLDESLVTPFLRDVVRHDPPLGILQVEVLPLDKNGLRRILFGFGAATLPQPSLEAAE